MAAKSFNTKPQTKWFENPIQRTFAILTGFVSIAAIGYSFATFQKNIECKIEKYELQQTLTEKYQTLQTKCEEEKQALENKRIEALEIVVKDLEQKRKGDKNEN